VKQDLSQEIAAFERERDELMKHHEGKFVIFKDGKLQGAFDTFDAAARDAIRRFKEEPFMIRQVAPTTTMPLPASVAYRPLNAPR
jgi:hypothetical protein